MQTDRIAPLYADPGPFASAYLEVSRDREDGNRLVELGARAVADQLREQGAPNEVIGVVQARLTESTHEGAPISRMVVASERGVLLDALSRSHTSQPTATWSPLPDLAAWIAAEDSFVPFVLARVDHEGGEVSLHASDAVLPEESREAGQPDHHEHKFRGGGWSHLRFQRVAEGAWDRNARAVAEEIDRHVRTGVRLVLLAGDVQARQLVTDALPDGAVEIVQLDSGGGRASDGGEEALRREVTDVLVRHAAAVKLAELHELRERLGREDAVAVGVRDVTDAFVRGQVDRLLLDPGPTREFTVAPAEYPGLMLGALLEPPESLPADQALIAAAAQTGAQVVVTPAATLGGAPVAALLRWDQPSVGTHP